MLTLNIYEKGQRVKKYEAETADILYGTIEDLIELIDLDKLNDLETKQGQLEVGKTILKGIPILMPFLKEIFIGLNDEEIRKTKVKELIPLFVEIFKYAFSELNFGEEENAGN
ncbi:unknown [Roseburia sp. CAG:309]|nr:unknown [Roseburia sp. CAG:309]